MFPCLFNIGDMAIFVDTWPVWYSAVLKYCISKLLPSGCHGEVSLKWSSISLWLQTWLLMLNSVFLLGIVTWLYQFGYSKNDILFIILKTDLMFCTLCILSKKFDPSSYTFQKLEPFCVCMYVWGPAQEIKHGPNGPWCTCPDIYPVPPEIGSCYVL